MSNSQEEKPTFMDLNVCSRLKEMRELTGMSQSEVAAALGVTSKTVWRWEKEIPIPSDKLSALDALGIDAVYVLTGEFRSVYQAKQRVEELAGVKEDGVEPYVERNKNLLGNFTQLDEQAKLAIEALIDALLTKK